jgi:hypothetical protein
MPGASLDAIWARGNLFSVARDGATVQMGVRAGSARPTDRRSGVMWHSPSSAVRTHFFSVSQCLRVSVVKIPSSSLLLTIQAPLDAKAYNA